MLNHTHLDLEPECPSMAAEAVAVIAARLRRDGFDFVGASDMRRLFEAAGGRDWHDYAASWDDLGPDRFMADGGSYRTRRFACFAAAGGTLRLKPPRPHFQTLAFNPLNGGVDRVFAPVEEAIAFHPANRAIVEVCRVLFEAAMSPAVRDARWHVEMHQFRIAADADVAGRPTPEGLHRDGVDWVLVLMVRRENVEGGTSTIADADRNPVREATLSEPLDASLIDDHRMFHGVTPIRPRDPSRPAFRDVLVVTFRAQAD